MKQFQYRIFNLSELSAVKAPKRLTPGEAKQAPRPAKRLDDALNELGKDGWQVVLRLSDASFMLMRENPEPAVLA